MKTKNICKIAGVNYDECLIKKKKNPPLVFIQHPIWLPCSDYPFCFYSTTNMAIGIMVILTDEPNLGNSSFQNLGGRHGCDCIVVGFTTTYAISAYHR